jgi:hypothetical protein
MAHGPPPVDICFAAHALRLPQPRHKRAKTSNGFFSCTCWRASQMHTAPCMQRAAVAPGPRAIGRVTASASRPTACQCLPAARWSRSRGGTGRRPRGTRPGCSRTARRAQTLRASPPRSVASPEVVVHDDKAARNNLQTQGRRSCNPAAAAPPPPLLQLLLLLLRRTLL